MVRSRSVSPEKNSTVIRLEKEPTIADPAIRIRKEPTIIDHTIKLRKELTKSYQAITLHWESINVHTPDTTKTLFNKIRCKKSESNSRHIIKDGN